MVVESGKSLRWWLVPEVHDEASYFLLAINTSLHLRHLHASFVRKPHSSQAHRSMLQNVTSWHACIGTSTRRSLLSRSSPKASSIAGASKMEGCSLPFRASLVPSGASLSVYPPHPSGEFDSRVLVEREQQRCGACCERRSRGP